MDIFKSWIVETPIAHRGLHNKTAPENSLGAFANAVEKGYAIELDVRIISDDTVVVFHDESLSRMTGNDGYLKFLRKEDLKILKLKGTKEHIPTLREVLDLVDGKTPIMIEIKNEYKIGKLEKLVLEELKNYKGEYAITSFNPFSLQYVKHHAPEVMRGQLCGTFKNAKLSFFKKFFLKRMFFNKKVSEPQFLVYESTALPSRFVRKYKNLPLVAWTVKSKEEYLKVVKYCDNIIFEGFVPEI